ncbi:MAG: hypothetical protein IJ348_05395 [Alistipes sp.]|nr:hypothetical protein [Alistipes sp.]
MIFSEKKIYEEPQLFLTEMLCERGFAGTLDPEYDFDDDVVEEEDEWI